MARGVKDLDVSHSIRNMRIHFYGTRGSGSTFPNRAERNDFKKLMEHQILEKCFEELSRHADSTGKIGPTISEILGGEINQKNLSTFRRRFEIPEPRMYGGWSTCVRIETADGYDIVLDCGSGFRNCAQDLQTQWGSREERHLHILGSHSHSDHTEGFDQAAVCFDPRNTIHIYGNFQFLFALDQYLGIFSRHVGEEVVGIHTPINYSVMPARFQAYEFLSQEPQGPASNRKELCAQSLDMNGTLRLGETRITPFPVFHPVPCLAYRIEHGEKKFVYCTDHELRHGSDANDALHEPDELDRLSREAEQRVIEQSQDADVLYRDGQYLRSEYDGLIGVGQGGPVSRVDWGHSCIEDVQEMAFKCRVKHTYIGHHDPNRSWSDLNWLDDSLARACSDRAEKIELAQAETVIDL